ncbi:MAG: DUF2207 domain-containing protein, partial [Candidatus Moraniibacteriota bacterium]
MTRSFGRQAVALACFLFVAAIPTIVWAQGMPDATEHIERFESNIVIASDGTIAVTETIRYAFGLAEKHGIYRDIPVKYATSLGTRTALDITVESVADETGKTLTYEESHSGGNLRIQIGDADRLITGTHTYVIRYRVAGALAFYQDFDELYWNATGHDWEVAIATALVTVRTETRASGWRTACYVGPRGSTEHCDQAASRSEAMNLYRVEWNEALSPGSGITIAIGFDKGYAAEPTWWERIAAFFKNNPLILLPFVVFGYMFRRWYREGRDPEGRGTIIPEYDVPEHLSPLHIAALLDGRLTGKEIPAAIINLAVKGYLRIERVTEKGLILDTTDYQLIELAERPIGGAIERVLLEALFGGTTANAESARQLLASPVAQYIPAFLKRSIEMTLPKATATPEIGGRTVKISELKNKFYTKIPELQKQAIGELVARKFLAASPQDVWGKYTLWGILFIIGGFFLIPFLQLQGASIVALVIAVFIYAVFAYLMPRVTREGAIVKEQLLGLKDYLQIAEKRRLEFHNAPEKTPELFERLLPAALLLGVSDIWAKEFADLTMSEPEWYHGGSVSSFSATSFASDLGGFNTAAGSSLASA